MLRITVPAGELWDEQEERFISTKEQTLQLEHSLVSLSKWESRWHKPFLSKVEKTNEEMLDYIKCMTITQNVDPNVYKRLTPENFREINEYIDNPMTATTFSEDKSAKKSREIITSELIYYWMVALNIPPEYQKWHLNRLITLVRVCNVKNEPPKKGNKKDIMRRYAEMNAANRKRFNSKG
jgi:hypothetical protein